MPELPEVEMLVRHLAPMLKGRTVREVIVRRAKSLAPTSADEMTAALKGKTFTDISRRGKYLLFTLVNDEWQKPIQLVGHLGMTGRMYLQSKDALLAKHTVIALDLDAHRFVFEDTRYFGRFTLDTRGLTNLGPEPLGKEFTATYFAEALKNSTQAIKIKLLDQTLVAGVGNIYASEALFLAGISPRRPANKLTRDQIARLRTAIRKVLRDAIRLGRNLSLDFSGEGGRDGIFYYGSEDAEKKTASRTIPDLRPGGKTVRHMRLGSEAIRAGGAQHILLRALPKGLKRAKIS